MRSKRVKLTIDALMKEAEEFCNVMSNMRHKNIAAVTDDKAVGTYIEHEFKKRIARKYVRGRGVFMTRPIPHIVQWWIVDSKSQ